MSTCAWVRPRWPMAFMVSILVLTGPALQTRAWAQTDDSWTFLGASQVWLSHIEKNGFASPSTLAGVILRDTSNRVVPRLFTTDSHPGETVDPQWGFQLAAQKGRWTISGAFQYVNFETRTDFIFSPPAGTPPLCPRGVCLSVGERFGREFVDTTRIDTDFAVTYFLPDVVPGRLDMSLGAGAKVIYASASREFGNLSPFGALANAGPPAGLYLICKRDDCSDLTASDRVKTKDWVYGLTLPMSGTVRLTSDAKWLSTLQINPFLGAETRDDRDVVYRIDENFRAQRLDGTTFAYGATADVSLRWVLNDTVSAYAGMRVQYIRGHETYLAYGPLLGMSVRFGGK